MKKTSIDSFLKREVALILTLCALVFKSFYFSIIGGVSIIVGLYLVIWARYNEEQRAPMDGYLDPLIVDNTRIPKTQESSLI